MSARMESTGLAEKIQMSQAAHDFLVKRNPDFIVSLRGSVEVKVRRTNFIELLLRLLHFRRKILERAQTNLQPELGVGVQKVQLATRIAANMRAYASRIRSFDERWPRLGRSVGETMAANYLPTPQETPSTSIKWPCAGCARAF